MKLSRSLFPVDAQNIPWAWDPRVALWKHVAQLGKAIDIAIGADGALWAISMDNKLRSFQYEPLRPCSAPCAPHSTLTTTAFLCSFYG